MARYSTTYSGSFGGYGAGADGRDIVLTGDPIPSDKLITEISYSLKLSADYSSSSEYWQMVEIYIDGTSIRDEDHSDRMDTSTNRHTFYGTMDYARSDIDAFSDGEFTLHAKANCTGKPTTYMWDVSVTVSYKDVYEMSDIDAPSSVEAGSSLTVTVNNAELGDVKHTITCSIGTYSLSKTIGLGVASCTFDIPIEWCNAITKATSGTLTIAIKAFESDGTSVGTTTITTTLEVPSHVKPTVASISVSRIAGAVPSSWGNVYVQNISGITIAANNCTPAYGSKIVSYVFGGAMATSSQESSCTLSPITTEGSVYFTVKCIDERGRASDEYVYQIDVIPYAAPYFSGAQAYRCEADGESNEKGTYIRAQAAIGYSSCNGKNSATLNCYYQGMTDSGWSNGALNMTPSTFYTFGGGAIAITNTYQVKFVITDAFNTVEKIITVSTSQWIIFIRRGGTAVGIGEKPRTDQEYIIDISEDWKILHGNIDVTAIIKSVAETGIPDIVYSPSQPAAKTGRIWLKPKG